jgi:hypothetical protein
MAFTPKGVPLGILNAEIWARDPAVQLDRKEQAKRPIEEKESFRWLQGYRHASSLAAYLGSTSCVVSIADSEGDIYDCLAETSPSAGVIKAHWLLRACQDRYLVGVEETKLLGALEAVPVMGYVDLDVQANRAAPHDSRRRKAARSARRARLTVQAACVTLRPSERRGRAARLPPVVANAILVREIDPPSGEAPIEWLLLTDLPIATWEEVQRVIGYYCARWKIEVYFKVLKSGCRVESLQMETTKRLSACLALYLIIAWRIFHVTMLGRSEEGALPCDLMFSKAEWMSVYTYTQRKAPPAQPPTLHQMMRMIASLGGFLGRKGDGEPGPKTMWIGMQRMRDFAAAWEAFGPKVPKILTPCVER